MPRGVSGRLHPFMINSRVCAGRGTFFEGLGVLPKPGGGCWSAGWGVAAGGRAGRTGCCWVSVMSVRRRWARGRPLPPSWCGGTVSPMPSRCSRSSRTDELQAGVVGGAADRVGGGQGEDAGEDVDADFVIGPVVHGAEGDHVRVTLVREVAKNVRVVTRACRAILTTLVASTPFSAKSSMVAFLQPVFADAHRTRPTRCCRTATSMLM